MPGIIDHTEKISLACLFKRDIFTECDMNQLWAVFI